ncbi:MAG: rRNA maturation RNase YbeY [bacterium]|nr:rRNA maturation RNase YbeY [bacterium]
MRVRIHREAPSPLPDRTVRRIAESVLADETAGREKRPEGELSVVLTDNDFIRGLNGRFLGRNRPTDVIAFPLGEEGGVWGEVYVSVERTGEQAAEYGVPPEQELARCVIHGVLHLLGYDDGIERDRVKMRRKEEEYLKKMGWDG